MRKNVFGRKLKRDTHERKALFKGLASSLVMYERIHTTTPKAKAIKGMVDRLVTYARKGGQHGMDLLSPYLTPDASRKLVNEITPLFADRAGGYTRIVKIGNRVSDNAAMAMMEWVVGKQVVSEKRLAKSNKKEKQEAKTTRKVVKTKEEKKEETTDKKPRAKRATKAK